jgi:hypothetical protein
MIEKIEAFWTSATADDVAKIANTRKSIQARFRDEDNEDWVDCLLVGWKLSKHLPGARWIDADGAMWNHCQVYREPSWYANKPDPGPGFRLLGKFPDEPKLGTDDCWNPSERKWQQVKNDDGIQEYQAWYRRRIEAVEPEQIKLDEGSKCPIQGCSGVLRFRPVKDCACHIRPPCSHCEDNPPRCEACEWAIGDPVEPVEPGPQHYILRVGDSVETPSGDRLRCVEPSVEQRHYQLRATDTVGTPSGQTITITEKGFEVTR